MNVWRIYHAIMPFDQDIYIHFFFDQTIYIYTLMTSIEDYYFTFNIYIYTQIVFSYLSIIVLPMMSPQLNRQWFKDLRTTLILIWRHITRINLSFLPRDSDPKKKIERYMKKIPDMMTSMIIWLNMYYCINNYVLASYTNSYTSSFTLSFLVSLLFLEKISF